MSAEPKTVSGYRVEHGADPGTVSRREAGRLAGDIIAWAEETSLYAGAMGWRGAPDAPTAKVWELEPLRSEARRNRQLGAGR